MSNVDAVLLSLLNNNLDSAPDVDWQLFLEQAGREGISPLIYNKLRKNGRIDTIPPWVIEKLRQSYYSNMASNIVMYYELGKILRAFKQKGIEVIVLKGAALAEIVYKNIALRPMCDVDLLVKREDLFEVKKVLTELGYACMIHDYELCQEYNETFGKELPFIKQDSPHLKLEIHWNLSDYSYYVETDPIDQFWENAIEVEISDVSTLILCPEDLIIYLCYHLAVNHPSSNYLLWFYDIDQVIRYYEDNLDWDKLINRAKGLKLIIIIPVIRTFKQLTELFYTPIPPRVFDEFGSTKLNWWRAMFYYIRAEFGLDISSRSIFDGKLMTKIKILLIRIFPYRDYMIKCYNIKHPFLLPLYYLLRPVKLLISRGKAALSLSKRLD